MTKSEKLMFLLLTSEQFELEVSVTSLIVSYWIVIPSVPNFFKIDKKWVDILLSEMLIFYTVIAINFSIQSWSLMILTQLLHKIMLGSN